MQTNDKNTYTYKTLSIKNHQQGQKCKINKRLLLWIKIRSTCSHRSYPFMNVSPFSFYRSCGLVFMLFVEFVVFGDMLYNGADNFLLKKACSIVGFFMFVFVVIGWSVCRLFYFQRLFRLIG